MDDDLDAVDHPAADDRPLQGVGCLHGAGATGRFDAIGVHGGERAAVPCVEGLEQVAGLDSSHLADDDMVGPVVLSPDRSGPPASGGRGPPSGAGDLGRLVVGRRMPLSGSGNVGSGASGPATQSVTDIAETAGRRRCRNRCRRGCSSPR